MSKKILVTGGAGFVGHHVIETLLRETNFEVVSLDRLDTSGTLSRLSHILEINPKWKSRLHQKVFFIKKMTAIDPETLIQQLKLEQKSFVWHMKIPTKCLYW